MSRGDIRTYSEGGKWKNKAEGNTRASTTYFTKAEAQEAGREMAIDREAEHIVKNVDGTI